MRSVHFSLLVVAAVMIPLGVDGGGGRLHDYADALKKCLLFFEGQRSGKLPSSQTVTWRKDSALKDGQDMGVDLVGGYYDAGDNVKFGFPMAFSTTMLSWSIIEFGKKMGAHLSHAEEAVRWATDYLLKATAEPNKVYVQVGDPYADHNCWERPEDMDTSRTTYAVDASRPGSEVSAETAAALAAASIVFRTSDPNYADKLLQRSFTVFDFADGHRGSYNNSLGNWVCPFYCDFSGYDDELLWAAAWIHKASNSPRHWKYIDDNIGELDQKKQSVGEFGWDDKYSGVYVLLYRVHKAAFGLPSDHYQQKVDEFACTILPESPTRKVNYSPGGLLFKPGGSNMQHPTALSFLLLTLARYLHNSNRVARCGNNVIAPPSRLIELAKGQVDYILGDNPPRMSYMVGYGERFPQRIHHRGSSLPSVEQHPERIVCGEGTPYYLSNGSNPNQLVGAVVGGPDTSDVYQDSRALFVQSEPTTYINAPMVGLLAYFKADAKAQSRAHG